jgi:hypothetical protein
VCLNVGWGQISPTENQLTLQISEPIISLWPFGLFMVSCYWWKNCYYIPVTFELFLVCYWWNNCNYFPVTFGLFMVCLYWWNNCNSSVTGHEKFKSQWCCCGWHSLVNTLTFKFSSVTWYHEKSKSHWEIVAVISSV